MMERLRGLLRDSAYTLRFDLVTGAASPDVRTPRHDVHTMTAQDAYWPAAPGGKGQNLLDSSGFVAHALPEPPADSASGQRSALLDVEPVWAEDARWITSAAIHPARYKRPARNAWDELFAERPELRV